MHWAARYIGLPVVPGARGPKEVDCWGLLHLVYKNEFGVELPLYPGISLERPLEATATIRKAIQEDWFEASAPFDGCAVAMSQAREIHHIGVYAKADGGKIIHCWGTQHVIADTPARIRLKGMSLVKFYAHKAWLLSSKH